MKWYNWLGFIGIVLVGIFSVWFNFTYFFFDLTPWQALKMYWLSVYVPIVILYWAFRYLLTKGN